MNIWLALFLCFFATPFASAKNPIDSAFPLQVLSGEDLAKSSDRSVLDILNSVPASADQSVSRQDAAYVRTRLGKQLVLVDGRRGDQDVSSIPTEMVDRVEILKDGATSVYGSDAVAGVVNYILKKPVHPSELPEPSAFTATENQWLSQNIPIGRIGIKEEKGQYNFGLSTYTKGQWSWAQSWGLGQSYGISGPIVALGKTPKGPALSVYSWTGAHIGDLNKQKIRLDTNLTGQYLMRAQYPELDRTYEINPRLYKYGEFDPQGVIIMPYRHSWGDIYRLADLYDLNLDDFDSYDEFMDAVDELSDPCGPIYDREPVFKRTVLDTVPNDPLYQKSKSKKKKGLVSGVFGGLVSVGGGIVGMGERSTVDKDGPQVYDQYSLPQIGFTPTSDPQSAWNAVDANSKNVVVAVIDSGLDLSHPDGPAHIWTNEQETAGNSIDDDHDGYVDNVNGWNFLDDNNDLTDHRGHGTVVAGIIAAKNNNGLGIAGINPGAVIMPLKVADKHGNTTSLNIFRAVKFAVLHGARVINISLGAKNPSELERLAINFARSRGVLVVVASGNSGEDITLHGPASVGAALPVGSVDFDGARSTVSNWGANNALMAPGEEIYSLQSKDAPWEGPAGAKERLYTKMSGTSFSAPMVAATASLLLVKNPKLTPDELEDILWSSARRMGPEDWEGKTGAGFLDAAKALRSIDQPHFNVKVTGLKTVYKPKTKKVESVDVYATVRGNVDYFIVELGKGKHARSFKPVIGIAGQPAGDDLVARLTEASLRGSSEWQVRIRAMDKTGKEHIAQLLLSLK